MKNAWLTTNMDMGMQKSSVTIQDPTKYFGYIVRYALYAVLRLEMYFELYFMVFNTFQQGSKILMHLVCLSVCPSVWTRSNCRKKSSNIFKFLHGFPTWCRIDSIENDMYGTKCSFTEAHKSFPIHFGLSGRGVNYN